MTKPFDHHELDLQALVEQVSWQYFNRPFRHQALWNARLRTSGGRYHLASHHLDFNPHLYAEYGEAVLLGIVKHELCHYHLHLAGKGYQHRDQDFKQLLRAVGGRRFAPKRSDLRPKYCYRCTNCQQEYQRQRQIDTQKYVCGRCLARLRLIAAD